MSKVKIKLSELGSNSRAKKHDFVGPRHEYREQWPPLDKLLLSWLGSSSRTKVSDRSGGQTEETSQRLLKTSK